jgi:class 3 adenylate cyclase
VAKRSARFHHCFQAPAARVWQGLADTARYNEAAGFPAHNITEIAQADGTQLFRGSARIGPLAVTWDDRPTNWIRDHWLEHTRLFERGPLARLTGRLTLTPDGGGRCEGVHEIEVEPRGLAGRAVAAFLLSKGRQAFERLAAQAEAWARGERAVPFDPPAPDLPVNAKRRAERIAAELVAAGHAAGPADRLLRLVLAGGETDVTRIRPLALARAWREPPEAVVALCLDATKRGLLSLSWDLLCPRCRGAKVRAPSLDKLPQGAHCPTCAVDYDRDFSRNCEATFRPAEAIRPLAGGAFCLLGPMGTPHILAHLTLAPGERREVPLDLPPGPYRFRTLEPGPEVALDHAGGPPPSVRYDGAAIAAEPGPGRGTGLVLANASPHLRTFVVEDRSWVADALTGDRLTAMQPFRDLFSDQVLRPGDEVGIGRIAILFSDLRGSTALYERIGDAAAYRRVREHFGYLAAIVRQHEGAIVKTIGDAVMAAFADPAQGVAAALAMQDHIGDLNRSSAGPPLVLKLGVHAGPCIAVTLNDRLDYFGRAVNLAARLLDVSQGADVVLSADLAAEPKVAALLEGRSLERGKTELRGFVGAVPFVQVAVGQGRWKELRTPDRRARKIASVV